MSPAPNADQTQALDILLVLTALFLVISTAMTIGLAILVRRSFWGKAADATDDAWRAQLLRLPLGAPEGSVRALLSIYVIVFGLLVLVMQNRLGLANVDAITGFIGMVITFYFTSRSEARRTGEPAHRMTGHAPAAPASTGTQPDTQPSTADTRHPSSPHDLVGSEPKRGGDGAASCGSNRP